MLKENSDDLHLIAEEPRASAARSGAAAALALALALAAVSSRSARLSSPESRGHMLGAAAKLAAS